MANENKKTKFEETTVKEAKTKVASSQGDNYVWGTRTGTGTKSEFQAHLESLNDADALIWSD